MLRYAITSSAGRSSTSLGRMLPPSLLVARASDVVLQPSQVRCKSSAPEPSSWDDDVRGHNLESQRDREISSVSEFFQRRRMNVPRHLNKGQTQQLETEGQRNINPPMNTKHGGPERKSFVQFDQSKPSDGLARTPPRPSWRTPSSQNMGESSMSAATNADAPSPVVPEDMKDVSALRAAFLKSVHLHRERSSAQSSGVPRKRDSKKSTNAEQRNETPSWRKSGNSQATTRKKSERNLVKPSPRLLALREDRQRRRRRSADSVDGDSFYASSVAAAAAAPMAKWRLNAAEAAVRSQDFPSPPPRPRVNRSENNFLETQREMMERLKRETVKTAETTPSSSREDHSVNQVITLPPQALSVSELSKLFRVKIDDLLQSLQQPEEQEDFMVDVDTMELVALELGKEVVRSTRRHARDQDGKLQRRVAEDDLYDSFAPRPPVVCIMGHVDHGKTTLMDALREKSQSLSKGGGNKKKAKSKKGSSSKSKDGTQKVAGTEAGGITQAISAFEVALENQENSVTFLDTPGHAAFKAMRASGSNAADVIVLVIAADDGVSPQTVEILDFYKSIVKDGGGISLVVAMTKVDKPGIDVSESRGRIENQLLEHGILTESFSSSGDTEYGPPVQLIPVSGLTGEGLDELIEGLVLQSEIMDLRADTEARAEGIVMDARMDKGLGVVADCIIRWGSLTRGDVVVSGVHSGKIKALKDVTGAVLKKGLPSQPVRIIGFKSLPKPGDPVVCVASEEVANELVERREAALDTTNEHRPEDTVNAELQVTGTETKQGNMLQNVFDKYGMESNDATQQTIRIPVVVKADTGGSLAAVRDSLVSIGTESSLDIVIDPVSATTGPVTASDVLMASESGAAIFSFGVKQNDRTALNLAEEEGVIVRSHNVIYSLLDDAKDVFAEHLPPAPVEHVHGKAIVQAVFDVNNKRSAERIAGLRVLDGTLFKAKANNPSGKGDPVACHYRVLRNGERISPEGEVLIASSLRKVKENVEDVRRGEECGLGLKDFGDFEEGDTIECYSIEMKRVFV